METNKIKQLQEFGQRIWLDFLDRNLIRSGQLKKIDRRRWRTRHDL